MRTALNPYPSWTEKNGIIEDPRDPSKPILRRPWWCDPTFPWWLKAIAAAAILFGLVKWAFGNP
jgi:hypothetical protein